MTGELGAPVASILIPTWDAADTLGFAVDSARHQTVADLEIVIAGDGVTPATRAVIEPLVDLDHRIRFLDLPKAPGRGERTRHAGVLACRSDLVVYLADDDLLLPWHVEQLVEAAASADLVQSLNGFVDADDRLMLWPTDLASESWRNWHLLDPPRNRVSITGTAHSRARYLELEQGWVAPKPGSWADLTLAQQFFRLPDLRAATLRRLSTLQFPAPLRQGREPEEIAAVYERWLAVVRHPDAAVVVADLQREAEWRELVRLSAWETDRTIELAAATAELDDERSARARAEEESASLSAELAELRATAAALGDTVAELRASAAELRASAAAAQADRERAEAANALLAREVADLRASTSWRFTAPMRAVTSRLRGRRAGRG